MVAAVAATPVPGSASAPMPNLVSRRDSFTEFPNRHSEPLARRAFLGGIGWQGSELVQCLASAIWERLPFSKLDTSQTYDRTEFARAYSESYQRLEQAASDVASMFAALRNQACRLIQDQRISADVRKEWATRHRESLDTKTLVPFVPPDTALTYKTVGEEGLGKRLWTALRDRVQQFATELCEAFQQLAKAQIVGRIEWANDSDCRFTFQQFQLSQEFLRTESKRVEFRDQATKRRGASTQESEVVRNIFSFVRHEHELINARQHELTNTVFPIPQPVEAFVKTIPEWMRPLLRVVEGTQIRERIGEIQTRSEEWSSQPKEVDRVLFHNDPALVFGPFVLMGWGQREVAAETERLSAEQAAIEQLAAERRQIDATALAATIGHFAIWSGIGLLVLAYAARSTLCWYTAWSAGLLSIAIPFLVDPPAKEMSATKRSVRRALLFVGTQAFLAGFLWVAIPCGVVLLFQDTQRTLTSPRTNIS